VADLDLDILLKLQDRATGPLRQTLGTIDKQAARSTSNIVNLGRTLRTHWLAATAVIAGAAFAFNQVIGSAIRFEDAFAGVRKTVDATEEEFSQLSDSLREMSKTIPVAVTDLAQIQTIAGQLGVRGVENLTKFTEVVAKIAVTTNLTREAAATNFARIANVMQEPLDNIDRMGSAIVELGNNFATTEAEIANFANRIAGAGRVAGLTTSDILGFGAAFSSVGVRAQRGGTAVSKALILMGTAVTEGGKKLKEFADIAGLTSEEFIEAYEESAANAFSLFIEGLGRSGLEGAAILKELELGDQRLVQAFLSVGGASGILTRAIDQSSDAFTENNALVEEAEKRFATTQSQVTILENNFNDLNIELGNVFLPTINQSIIVLKEFTEELGRIPQRINAISQFATLLPGVTNIIRALQDEVVADTGETTQEIEEMWQALAFAPKFYQDALKETSKLTTTLSTVTSKVTKDQTKEIADAVQENISTTQFFFDFLSQTVSLAAEENKRFAALAKAVRVGQAIINTATAVTRAFADFPWPFSIGVAALMASLGAAQVAIISGQTLHKGGEIKKAHDGGVVGSDEVPIIAQTGEGVLSRQGMTTLGGVSELNRLNAGEGRGFSVNIENASFRNEDDVEDVIAQISTAIEEQRRARI